VKRGLVVTVKSDRLFNSAAIGTLGQVDDVLEGGPDCLVEPIFRIPDFLICLFLHVGIRPNGIQSGDPATSFVLARYVSRLTTALSVDTNEYGR